MDFVVIPEGRFLMGENPEDKFANDTERPRHAVEVPAFFMAKSPVTVGEYRRFRPGHEPGTPEEWPAVLVSWEDAVAFCEWLGDGCRLPTEAEWEYAARAGSQQPYPWGNTISRNNANYYYNEEGHKTGPGHRTAPGSYPANPFMLRDMCGNVCEWVQDTWHGNYHDAPPDGSAWTAGGRTDWKVLRGGAWDYMPRLLRTSWRDCLHKSSRRDNVGFRVAGTL